MKDVRWYKEEARRLGEIFIREKKDIIFAQIELLTGKKYKELKYITVRICFSWNEARTTVIEAYDCRIYGLFDDEIQDILKTPSPEMKKDFYIRIEGKCVSATVRFFDPI
jgi:hypothetical protein